MLERGFGRGGWSRCEEKTKFFFKALRRRFFSLLACCICSSRLFYISLSPFLRVLLLSSTRSERDQTMTSAELMETRAAAGASAGTSGKEPSTAAAAAQHTHHVTWCAPHSSVDLLKNSTAVA